MSHIASYYKSQNTWKSDMVYKELRCRQYGKRIVTKRAADGAGLWPSHHTVAFQPRVLFRAGKKTTKHKYSWQRQHNKRLAGVEEKFTHAWLNAISLTTIHRFWQFWGGKTTRPFALLTFSLTPLPKIIKIGSCMSQSRSKPRLCIYSKQNAPSPRELYRHASCWHSYAGADVVPQELWRGTAVETVSLRQRHLPRQIYHGTLHIGRQWLNFVYCLCHLVFTAILWVKLLEMLVTPLSLKYALSVG